MIHPNTELALINETIGHGVIATKFIPRGTIIWVLDELDQKLAASYVASLDPLIQKVLTKYCYRDYQGYYILCWDIARFVNHSFTPTMIGTAYNFELAVRDIYPGEELTDDYGYFNLDQPFDCLPEPDSLRMRVMPDDILNFYQDWDQKAATAMRLVPTVDQPLLRFMDAELRAKVGAIAAGQEPMDSILSIATDFLN